MTVTDRFLRYISVDTASSETSGSSPSTPGQLELGRLLTEELRELGLPEAHMDSFGYVYAFLPGTPGEGAGAEALGLIAHMDTSPDAPGRNIRPARIRYEGGDIPLASGAVLSPQRFPSLGKYIGEELIVTDGTTLLGADDKAGVAEIMTLVEYLLTHPEVPHRPLSLCFTPDEEIGCGTDHFNFADFPAPVAYTVDGGEIGEIEYENFNAASADIQIQGVNIHPGSAKNQMKNAVLLAAEFISRMPAAETPAHTEGYEGFYHISDIEGCESHASLHMIIRDHDRASFEKRKAFVENLAAYLNGLYGDGTFRVTIRDSYYNMKEKILSRMDLIEKARAAMEEAGVTPQVVPIRGGTDGARLSYQGLPCPNLCTGGVNFHSVYEYIPVSSLEAMVRVLQILSRP